MDETIQAIMNNITVPIITAVGALLLLLVKNFTDKISKSIVKKNESESIENMFAAKKYLIEQISLVVKSVVASNMELANDMKSYNGTNSLDDEQAILLADKAVETVKAALPGNLTDPNDQLYKTIGGAETLDSLIRSLIEKYVYQYKNENCCK